MNSSWSFLQDPSGNLGNLKKHWWSKAEHIICTCWFQSGMQRASLLGNKHSLWPVCLHCSAVLTQEMSSPPDECFLYYYTPPSGSPRRSPSVSAAGGAWQRTVSLLGHFPWTVSGPGHLSGPRGNLSSLSPVAPGLCSLLCCTQHRGSGWSPVAASPVQRAKRDIRLGFDRAPFSLLFTFTFYMQPQSLSLQHIISHLNIKQFKSEPMFGCLATQTKIEQNLAD